MVTKIEPKTLKNRFGHNRQIHHLNAITLIPHPTSRPPHKPHIKLFPYHIIHQIPIRPFIPNLYQYIKIRLSIIKDLNLSNYFNLFITNEKNQAWIFCQ
jgi:hypothetical protein